MRIGIDMSKALGRPDGVGRYTAGLVRALMALDGENHYRLYPLFQEPEPEAFRARFPGAPERFALQSRRRPGPGEVDVFHATTHSVPVGLAAPLVFTLYDLSFLSHPHCHTLGNRLHCLRGTARALARGARLVAISESTRRDAVELLGVAAEEVEVIYPGIEEGLRPPGAEERARVLAHHGLGEPFVLTVGTLEPRKNLVTLLAAFAALPGELRRGHRLAVVGGEGWLERDPRTLAREAGLEEGEVRFLGAVDDAHLPALYAGAAAFAYPSLYEGFGLPPLEAMACGAPVVAARTSSLPEVLGDAALLVEPTDAGALRDALAAVLTDAERSAALRAAGRERAERFTWARAAEGMLAVYRRAVEG